MPRRERHQRRIAGTFSFSGLTLLAALWASPGLADEPAYANAWSEILSAHTRSVTSTVGTTIDYAALRGPSSGKWRALVRGLAETPRATSREQKLALWINAYNVLAIDMVVQNGPVESIRDLGSFFSPVWKRPAGTVAGREVTLHEIEHEILRPMGEPRIHASIVCASTSCPSLRRSAFTVAGLETQLDDAMTRWLASPTKGLRIDRAGSRILLSKIFDWFEEDFEGLGGVRNVVTKYAPQDDRAWLAGHAPSAELDYFDYDWTLNDWTRGSDEARE